MDRVCGAMHLIAIEEKVAFYLLNNGFNIKRKNIKEKKSIRSINPLKLIKRVKVLGNMKRENKFPPLRFRQDILCIVYTHTQSKAIQYLFRRSNVLLLPGSLEYVNIQ